MVKNSMSKKALISGGTGFIGSNISNMLAEKGHQVIVFDNNKRGKTIDVTTS